MKKHPLHIAELVAPPKNGRITQRKPEFWGLDVESDHTTGEPKLMHVSKGALNKMIIRPHQAPKQKARSLALYILHAASQRASLVHWGAFDRMALLRTFCDADPQVEEVLITAYMKRETRVWRDDHHDITVSGMKTGATFTVSGHGEPVRVPLYNAKNFYSEKLEISTRQNGINYAKGAKELHLVDWKRYQKDPDFRRRVDESNQLDAQVAALLLEKVADAFHATFGQYPTNYYSAGSLAKSALQSRMTKDDYEALSWRHFQTQHETPLLRDLWCMAAESYSGGLIDSFLLGNVTSNGERAYISDLTSCYPGVIRHLPDLRNSILIAGTGPPPHSMTLSKEGAFKTLLFVRGRVRMPKDTIHPLSYSNYPSNSKSRRYGEGIFSYTLVERETLEKLGGTFTDETWIGIKTSGIPSPMARVVRDLILERERAKGTASELRIKEATNSIYGLSYQHIPHHNEEGAVTGYTVGELYNPLYASTITSYARCTLSLAADTIRRKHGRVVSLMTDSVSWIGRADMLPKCILVGGLESGWTDKKAIGMFEKPSRIAEYLNLGVGRYEYVTESGKRVAKHRGYHLPDVEDESAPASRSLKSLLESSEDGMIDVEANLLISPGLKRARKEKLLNRGLALIYQESRKLDPLELGGKRWIPKDSQARQLSKRSLNTQQLGIPPNVDNTLPDLRERYLKVSS